MSSYVTDCKVSYVFVAQIKKNYNINVIHRNYQKCNTDKPQVFLNLWFMWCSLLPPTKYVMSLVLLVCFIVCLYVLLSVHQQDYLQNNERIWWNQRCASDPGTIHYIFGMIRNTIRYVQKTIPYKILKVPKVGERGEPRVDHIMSFFLCQ